MGKANPRKKLWVEAAKVYIAGTLDAFDLKVAQRATLQVLDFFAGQARTRKNARDRNKVWYEQIRDYVIAQMQQQDVVERKTAYGNTHYMLVPNLTMGKDEDGMRRFQNLIDEIGLEEAEGLVNVTTRHIPSYEVETVVRDPRFHDGEELSLTESTLERTEIEYTFVGSGDTKQLLEWTAIMGNKPSFDVGPAPKRVKEGKQRRKH